MSVSPCPAASSAAAADCRLGAAASLFVTFPGAGVDEPRPLADDVSLLVEGRVNGGGHLF